jgi:peptidoglycan/xylan/chitin deacetylase (PgdA/CDA1 family)
MFTFLTELIGSFDLTSQEGLVFGSRWRVIRDASPGLGFVRCRGTKMLLRKAAETGTGMEPVMRAIDSVGTVLGGPKSCFFTFHRVAEAAKWARLPNRNFYLELEYLERLLSYLVETGREIVTVEECLRRVAAGETGKKFVNFSVDDCYRDTFEEVVPLFRKFGVPVTLFVTSGIPDGHMPMWGAGLEEILLQKDCVNCDGRRLEVATPQLKREAFKQIERNWDAGDAFERYAAFCEDNDFDAGDIHRKHAISWEMLDELKDDPLVEIGAHTVNHARISALSEDEALAELVGCRNRIADRLGVEARHFAFPYGRAADAGPRDFELAKRAGYSSASTTRKGLFRGGDRFSLPRNTLNGAAKSLAMAEAHLWGITGFAAKMLGRI